MKCRTLGKMGLLLLLALGLQLGAMVGEALASAATGGTADWGRAATWNVGTGYNGRIEGNTTLVYNNPSNTLYDPLYATVPDIQAGYVTGGSESGYSGWGTLYVNAGSLASSGAISLGRTNNGLDGRPTGLLYVQGGTLTGTSLGQSNGDDRNLTGVATVSGGMLQLSGSSTLGSNRPWAYLRLTGGTLDGFVNASVHTLEGNGAISNYSGTLTLDTPASTRFDGPITGTGSLLKKNAGIIALTADSTYSGTTTINQGGFRVTFGAASPTTNILGNAGLIMSSGVLDMQGKYDTTNNQAFAGLTLNPGQASIRLTSGGAISGAMNVSLGAITRNVGGTVDFTKPVAGVIDTSSTSTNGILGGWATYAGSGWANMDGLGITALATYGNAYASGENTDVASGVSSPGLALNVNSLRFNAAGASTLTLSGGGLNTVQSGGILVTSAVGANATQIAGGTLATGNGGDLIVQQNNTAGTLTISAPIANAPSNVNSVTKAGAGLAVFSGANTYTGGTKILGGSAKFESGAVPATGTINIGQGAILRADGAYSNAGNWLASGKIDTTSSGVLALTANESTGINASAYPNLYLGAAGGTVTISGTITPLTDTQTYRFGGGSGTLIISSNITSDGAGAFFAGPGKTVLAGTANYFGSTRGISTGNITVESGLLQFNANSFPKSVDADGVSPIDIRYGGGLVIAGYDPDPPPFGAAGVTVQQWLDKRQGTLAFSHIDNRSQGAVVLSTSNATALSSNINMNGTGGYGYPELSLGAEDNVDYTATLTPYSKTLSFTNVSNGTTTITATGSDIYRLGGGGGKLTYQNPLVDGTAPRSLVIGGGPGTVVLPNNNTFTGPTTVKTGTLIVTGSLNSAGAVSVENGGTLRGSGSMGAITVRSGGILAPGRSDVLLNALSVNSLVLQTGAVSNFRISPSSLDQVMAANSVTFGGMLNVSDFSAGALTSGTYDLFDFSSQSGFFSGINLPAAPAGLQWKAFSGSFFDYANGLIELETAGGKFWGPAVGGGGTAAWTEASSVWAGSAGAQGTSAQSTGEALVFGNAPGTVTVNGAVYAAKGLTFSSDGYNVAAGTSPSINLTGATAADNTITVSTGTTSINVPVALLGGSATVNVSGDGLAINGTISGSGRSLTKNGGGTLLLDAANSYSGGTMVNGGVVLLGQADALPVKGNLVVNSGAAVYEDTDLGNAVQVGRLTINGTGKFNLSDGKLVVDGALTSEAAVRAYIVAGRNGGNWAGPGITSSWATADSVTYSIGYMKNSDLGSGAPTTWFGRSVNMDSVLVRLTYAGDADLSGDVTTDDFDKWKYSYAETLPATWYNGDFDYSGYIDTDDFDKWKYAYSFSYPALDAPYAAAVPEPGTLGLLAGLASLAAICWRRKRTA